MTTPHTYRSQESSNAADGMEGEQAGAKGLGVAQEPTTSGESQLSYRPDIDGLRAIAVVSVLIHHVYPELLPGGFVGVDIFFVISGFLISRIIWQELARGCFTIRRFYERRIRRIFPALILVLAASWLVGWALDFWDDFARLGKHIFAGAFFVSNFALWSEGGYFDIAAERKPLLHLWSLSIEEQFYLFWPLALWLCSKMRVPFLLFGLPLGIASFGYGVWLSYVDETAAFYNPFARFWELCLGALAGWIAMAGKGNGARARQMLPTAGLLMIVASLLTYSAALVFPGWVAAAPALGTAILLWCPPSSVVHSRLLASSPLVWIGLISYPLYLWHWPLLSFSTLLLPPAQFSAARNVVIPASVLLAWLTYALVEIPIRKRRSRVIQVRFLLIGMVFVGALGGVTYLCRGFVSLSQEAHTPSFLAGKRELGEWLKDVRVGSCHLQLSQAGAHEDACMQRGELSVAIFGDSHAAALYQGLAHLRESQPFALSQFTAGGCPPLLDTEVASRANCAEVNRGVAKKLADLQPSALILDARWYRREMGIDRERVLDRLRYTIGELRKLLPKTKIVLVGPVPEWQPDLPRFLTAYINEHKTLPPAYVELPKTPETAEVKKMDVELAQLAQQLNVEYVSVFSILCEGDRCLTRLGDAVIDLVVFDDAHLNAPAAALVAEKMKGKFLR